MKEDNNEKINKKINIFIIIINIIFIYCINYLVVIILNIQNNCFNIFFFFLTHTLSSIVSNLVNIIPSICLGFWRPEKSLRDWLNLVNWSTASLPTKASPTKIILSGSLTVTNCNY